MSHRFDDFTRAMGQATTRRRMLSLLAAGSAAALVGNPEIARAAPRATDQALTYPPGWNLVGGPAGSHVLGAAGPLYGWLPDAGMYAEVPSSSPLEDCRGYWAYLPDGGSLEPGQSSDSCTLALTPGQWTLAGGPSAAMAATIMGDAVAFVLRAAGGYKPTGIIPIGHGAWLKGSGSVTLIAGSGPRPEP